MKKARKIISVLLLFAIIFLNLNTYADDLLNENDSDEVQEQLQEATVEPTKVPTLNSRAAIIYDRISKTILYGKQENTKRPMASTTKVMTSIVVLEKAKLSDVVEVSKKAAGTGGSRLGLKTGDKITVHDLLYGLMLCSGNDAAVPLAEYVGGSVAEFAEFMNQKSKELELKNTSFVTPHGLDAQEHYTTAYELAKMTDYALNIQEFYKIVGTKEYTISINGESKNIRNTNELLGNLNGVYGVKTGFTNGANRCLVTSTKRDDMDIICVVLGADTKKNRTQDSAKLIEYAFSNYQMIDLQKIVQEEFEKRKSNNIIDVIKGEKENLEYDWDTSIIGNYPILKEEVNDIEIKITIQEELVAPVYLNQVVGEIKILVAKKEILQAKITAKEEINKKGIYNYFKEFILKYPQYVEKVIR